MIITREFDSTRDYDLPKLLKTDGLVKVEALVNDALVEVKNVSRTSDVFFEDNEGEKLHSWNIKKIVLTFVVDPTFKLGETVTFDEPAIFDRKSLEKGAYICKYIDVRNMRIAIDILNIYTNTGDMGGMFLFDLKENYRMLSIQKIT
ncbi:hypothetical protein Acj9p141 [Acinetobacter phage Acj9]|uniref:Uncharacterized protein n=1 Tax=Acinetobacter phage Acj9 TaxID=760939 RepID=E5EPS5_9CAUD|nr:hypothetical protein Acj9p141 [Acinetobacter phage Acj9]ADG60041.1 hypothetical protein Acj9p141 [Acinetobacter phage Acj9]